MNKRPLNRHRFFQVGFTLIELAIVLVILGLVLGGLVVPLAAQVQSRKVNETAAMISEIKESLYGFAIANGRLPCPATIATNGMENRRNDDAGIGPIDAQTEGCRAGNYSGLLPWATLGVSEIDAWGNRFRYRVTNEFTRANGDATAIGSCVSAGPVLAGTDPNACTLELMDVGNLTIETRDSITKTKRNLSTFVPAIVISFGRNGHGATNNQGVVLPTPPATNLDENQNTNAVSVSFLSRSSTDEQAGCSDTAAGQPFCEFDDLVSWIPTSVLLNRLLAAGRLP
jgi:prepilin-type N-terminal cleavage/methylation domain-containing protein